MKKLAVIVLAALAVGWFSSRATVSQEEVTPARMGFLDIQRVYKEYRRQKQAEREFRRAQAELESKTRKLQAEIETQAQELNELNEGSDDYRKLVLELDIRKFTLKRDYELMAAAINAEAKRTEERIYREICLEVQAHAENGGLTGVFMWRPLESALGNGADLEVVIGTRTVLHRDADDDITDVIIQSLNAALPPEPTQPGGAGGDGTNEGK